MSNEKAVIKVLSGLAEGLQKGITTLQHAIDVQEAKAQGEKEPKEPKQKRTKRTKSGVDMSCRHEGCNNRSKGPRFGFYCEEHVKEHKKGKKSAAPKKPKAEKAEKGSFSAAKMRCRFVDADGTRCRAKSKGPRFGFYCEEHVAEHKKGGKKAKKAIDKANKVAAEILARTPGTAAVAPEAPAPAPVAAPAPAPIDGK